MRRTASLLLAILTACGPASAGNTANTADSAAGDAGPELPSEGAPIPSAPTSTTPAGPRMFFVFMPDGIDPGLVERARSIPGVTAVAVTHSGTLHVVETRDAGGTIVDRPAPGFVIPVEARTVDEQQLGVLLGMEEPPPLGATEVILGETSAEIRRLDVGGRITFDDGVTLTVSAVLPDTAVGSAELIVAEHGTGDERLQARSARITFDGEEERLEAALRALLPPDTALRVREVGGSRRVGLVRSPAAVKQRFGEFAFQPGVGGRITIDPAWVEANIVLVDIPLLGAARCHREFAAMLTDVMHGLIDDGLAYVIDPGAFSGCWNPRRIAGSTRLSRHAYGAAADINFGNPTDGRPGSPVHPELLARMEAAGITSGHQWTNPDPGHFEWYGTDG